MAEIFHDIELGESWTPKRNPLLLRVFDSLLPRWIAPIAVFMAAIIISILLESKIPFRIISLLGVPLGLLMILPLWITLVIPSGFLGLLNQINRLFTLLRSSAFDGSQLLLIPTVFLSKIIYVSLTHGNLSYRIRLSIFIASCTVIVSGILIIGCYAAKNDLLGQTMLAYGLELFIFIAITLNDYTRVARRRRRNGKRFRAGEEEQNT